MNCDIYFNYYYSDYVVKRWFCLRYDGNVRSQLHIIRGGLIYSTLYEMKSNYLCKYRTRKNTSYFTYQEMISYEKITVFWTSTVTFPFYFN